MILQNLPGAVIIMQGANIRMGLLPAIISGTQSCTVCRLGHIVQHRSGHFLSLVGYDLGMFQLCISIPFCLVQSQQHAQNALGADHQLFTTD